MKQLFCILFFGILLFSCSNGTTNGGKTLEAEYVEADTLFQLHNVLLYYSLMRILAGKK